MVYISRQGGNKRHPLPNTAKTPHSTKYDICGTHSSTLLLDDSKSFTQLSLYTYHNERWEETYFSFTGIDITTRRDIGVNLPILAEEEVAQITHNPILSTSLHLEEDMVA